MDGLIFPEPVLQYVFIDIFFFWKNGNSKEKGFQNRSYSTASSGKKQVTFESQL